MTPELAGALAAILLAAASFLRGEVAARRAQRRREEVEAHLSDVQRKVGADRRAHDVEP